MKYLFALCLALSFSVSASTMTRAGRYDNAPVLNQGHIIQVQKGAINAGEFYRYIKDNQLEVIEMLDKYFTTRNEMNILVEPRRLRRPPQQPINRAKYESQLAQLEEQRQAIVAHYYHIESQIYEWHDVQLLSEILVKRGQDNLNRFKMFLLKVFEYDAEYLESFDDLITLYEEEQLAYYITDNTINFIKPEVHQHFEKLKSLMEYSSDRQKHYIGQLKYFVK